MKEVCWPYFDPDFDNLPERIYGPMCVVSIDNESMEDCTLVKVDSVKKQGLLLEVVQVLTDSNLSISKSYISSDAGWFMDVFHVKDKHGNKLTDQSVIDHIQQAIGRTTETRNRGKAKAYSNNTLREPDHHTSTAIEMTGTDRPGLFSEISATLEDLNCNIVEAHAWSHNAHLACIAYISDQSTDTPIADPQRLETIEAHLNTIVHGTTTSVNGQDVKRGTGFLGEEVTNDMDTITNVERRLHQLMLSARDFDGPTRPNGSDGPNGPSPSHVADRSTGGVVEGRKMVVRIEKCEEKGYSIVSIECRDRARLMFDTVCTLTDMQYVIFHASIRSNEGFAFQEYFIRHVDGRALSIESEKERVIKCLEAAIERRVCEGMKLKLCAENRVGLVSDVTRIIRENGLAVVRADIATKGEKAVNAFYLRDVSGNEVHNMELVESMKREMGPTIDLQVKNVHKTICSGNTPNDNCDKGHRFSFGDMLKSHIERFSHNFIAIK